MISVQNNAVAFDGNANLRTVLIGRVAHAPSPTPAIPEQPQHSPMELSRPKLHSDMIKGDVACDNDYDVIKIFGKLGQAPEKMFSDGTLIMMNMTPWNR